MFRSLMWKEFREHIWKIVALTAMLLSPLFAIHLWIRGGFSGLYNLVELEPAMMVFAALIAPVWIASWTVAGEKRDRGASLNALISLPASPAAIFAIKSAWGVCSLFLPLLIAFAFWQWLYTGPPRNLEPQLWSAILLSSICLYFAIVALAVHRQRESTVATIGVLVLAFFGVWILAFSNFSYPLDHWMLLIPNPFLALYMFTVADRPVLHALGAFWDPNILAVQFVVTFAWWLLAARRFHRAATHPITLRPSIHLNPRILAMPMPTDKFPYGSLIWKECREQYPVLGLATFITFWIPIIIAVLGTKGHGTTFDAVLEIFCFTAVAMACVTSVVLGVGPMAGDLEPHTRAFWQSQPISFRQWFWTKYLIGLSGTAILLLGFGFLTAAAGIFVQGLINLSAQTDAELEIFTLWHTFIAGIFILPAIYSFSFFLASATRHTFYAAILALTFVPFLLYYPWLPARNGIGRDALGYVLAGGQFDYLFALCAVATLAGTLLLAKLSRIILARGWHFS